MKIYLIEYINDDVYKLIKEKYEITNKIEECDIVISRNLIVDKNFIDKAINLKCVAMYGTGIDGIDLEYAKSKGITVFNAPKFNSLSVAEINLALMLGISRKIEKWILGKISLLTAKMLKFGLIVILKPILEQRRI